MDSERYATIKGLCLRARSLPVDGRAGFLDEACANDEELRAEVEGWLASDQGEPVEPVGVGRSGDTTQIAAEGPGTVLGNYRIVEPIGEGGMGTVWLAQQEEPVQRQVALKIIKLGMDTREVVLRFEAERQALAVMDHPHIAKVFDGGATATGRPFFVMEYVEGVPITEFCDRHSLSLGKRLELFAQVCEAIQHAHQKGIIHRDIKPNNVLVTLQDGVPVPRVIDFGIAKATGGELTEKTMLTQHAQIIGTPEYMAPEQADGSAIDIDTRADVYSLGVLLYELLTGKTPFDLRTLLEAGYAELLRTIREVDPVRPSTLISTIQASESSIAERRKASVPALERRVRGELDWIVMKALEKDRTRRYESASSLAADVARYLANEPIEAAPPSTAYRVRKFVRRNRLAVGAAAVFSVTLVCATAGLGWLYTRSVAAESRASLKAETSRQALDFMSDIFAISDPSQARGESVTAREVLERGAERIQRELADQPEVRSTLMAAMGSSFAGLGLYHRADKLLAEAAKVMGEIHGKDHPETLHLSGELARVWRMESRLVEAEALLRETLERQREILGPEHPATIDTCINLSQTLEAQNRYDESQALIREALETARRALGEEHMLTLVASDQLGVTFMRAARFEEAEEQLALTLEAARSALGEDHPQTLTSLGNLGELYKRTGRFEECEQLYEMATETILRVFGEEHPHFLLHRANLALLYFEQERWEDCESIYREILELQRRLLGDLHLDTLTTINSVGTILRSQDRSEEAEPFLVEAYEGLHELLGDEHERTITVIGNLSMLYLYTGRMEQAEVYATKSFESSAALHGEMHPLTLLRMENLANVYFTEGNFAGTAEILEIVLDGRREVLGNDHAAVTRTLVNLCNVMPNLGEHDRLRSLRQELLERSQSGQGAEFYSAAVEIENLGKEYLRKYEYGPATECLEEVLRILRVALGDEDPRTLGSMRDVLQSATLAGRWAEFEPLASGYYEAHVRGLAQDSPKTARCVQLIADGYAQAGDAERAQEWSARLE